MQFLDVVLTVLHTYKIKNCQNTFWPECSFIKWAPGVDVMITVFGDFSQFSAKKIGVFLKYQCYDQLFSKFSFVLNQKRQFFFAKIFGENI
jgi:hypothetical protein